MCRRALRDLIEELVMFRSRALRTAACVVLTLWAGCAFGAHKEDLGKVEILRDTWGAPHVFAETDVGAMHGLGYATAQDRAFQMYYSLRIIQGRVCELIGDVPKKNGKGTSFQSDRKMRVIGWHRAAAELVDNLDEETVRLLQAYSDGVNAFVTGHRDELLYLFDKLGLEPEPWTPADCIASWWHMGQFFAGDGTRDLIPYHEIRDGAERRRPTRFDDGAAVIRRQDVSTEWVRRTREFAEKLGVSVHDAPAPAGPRFSHAWVVGGNRTSTGGAVLCSDPQTPVRNPSMFYEFHVCGKTFNARGIGVPGSPVVLIGWNEHVAWGVTALGVDQADLFVLRTDTRHPDQYFFDGQWRDMDARDETIHITGGRPRRIIVRETHLGPVVTGISLGVRPGEEVALKRIPICETDRETVQGALAMIRSQNVNEFAQAIGGWRFPSVNMLCGDRNGDIGYWALAAVPIRSRHALSGGRAAHQGTSSDNDWQSIVPYDMLPHAINTSRGYFASGNNRPIASFYKVPLGTSTGWPGDSIRSWRLRELLEARQTFDPRQVLDIHFDSVNPMKRGILRIGYHLRDILNANLSPETLRALRHMETWYQKGAQSDMSVKGNELANLIGLPFRPGSTSLVAEYGGGQSGLCLFLKTAKARLGEDPEASFDDAVVEYVDKALTKAWQAAARRYGRDPENWHRKAKEMLRTRKLGFFESLDGFSSLDPEHDLSFPPLTCIDGGTIRSQAAQSYTQWVPLHDVDAAMSILPVGQSEDPGSSFRTSTYEMWSRGELHPAPITRKAVEEHVVSCSVLSP